MIKIITANIGRDGMSTARVREDLLKIKKQRGSKFICFQEIDEADPANEHGLVRSTFKRNVLAGMNHMEPIVAPWGAKLLHNRTVKACDGIPHITPARFFNVAVFEYRNQKFVIINCHYPAGAYNGHVAPGQHHGVMAAWEEMFKKHQELVNHYLDKGYTVFWTGDVNRIDMPKVHPNERRLWSHRIDSISVIESGFEFKVHDKGSFPLNSDHDGCWVSGELIPRGR